MYSESLSYVKHIQLQLPVLHQTYRFSVITFISNIPANSSLVVDEERIRPGH